ncbi:hypothetical protein IAT38_000976 [Cryptococcus sp. DSM 104549]
MPPTCSSPLVDTQLSTLEIISSMYPELLPSSSTASFTSGVLLNDPAPPSLEADLTLKVDDEREEQFSLQVSLSLTGDERREQGEVEIRPRQPLWLPRATYEALVAALPPQGEVDGSEYVLSTVEWVREYLVPHLPSEEVPPEEDTGLPADTPIERVWFWFPTLSTREKRNDIVSFAEDVGLTGFVLAGKPALLCVEGPALVVEKYMSRIKSESWSDIPPFQKKVSERLRRPLPSPASRAFTDMKEITHLIPTYGQYNHRVDMSEVRQLMEQWGVGEDFGAVVMNSGA